MRWRTVKNDLQITVKPGDSVTLPCQVDKANAEAVKWTVGKERLCLNRNHNRKRCENVASSYENRVEMAGLWKENGNASLELINATVSDTGTYECSVGNGGDTDPITTIKLTVEPGTNKDEGDKDGGDKDGGDKDGGNNDGEDKDGGDKSGHVGLIVDLLVVLLLVAVGGFVIYRKCKVKKNFVI
ncbi:pheromone-processing carboxypeptidase KEX1-like [Anabas testudineus]|uniref:pheromone-processing carboxypeptidase KEX1-like n=1 Tax=Anabas testudineus TaxID=64144 RepID=UPI000E46156C|nr:pheromone-processing carboxypeptidase KEX1-like [Anabas testudineus]